MELRVQRALNAFTRLVPAPKLVAEGFDDMVRRNAQVRRAFLDHLQGGVEHTHDGAERPILVLGEATQTIEMAEKLVCTVDEMNDHEALFLNCRRILSLKWRR